MGHRNGLPGIGLTRGAQVLLSLLVLGFVVLLVAVNASCAGYFGKPAMFAWVLLSLAAAAALAWAVSADHDTNRLAGSVSAGLLAGIWLGTVSIPVLFVPVAIVGCLRLPRARTRWASRLLMVPVLAKVFVGLAVPVVLWMSSSAVVCG